MDTQKQLNVPLDSAAPARPSPAPRFSTVAKVEETITNEEKQEDANPSVEGDGYFAAATQAAQQTAAVAAQKAREAESAQRLAGAEEHFAAATPEKLTALWEKGGEVAKAQRIDANFTTALGAQEGENGPNIDWQDKIHRGILRGLRNISEAP